MFRVTLSPESLDFLGYVKL